MSTPVIDDALSLEKTHGASDRRCGGDVTAGTGVQSLVCKAEPMRIGILGGTGPAGTALGARLASVGYDVTFGSRSKYRAMESVDGILAQWPDYDLSIDASDNEGAAGADVVVLATPWDSAATTAHALEKQLNGKVVISMANALVKVGHEFQPLVPPRGSVAASVQAAVPGCHVAAAFHHLPAARARPSRQSRSRATC